MLEMVRKKSEIVIIKISKEKIGEEKGKQD